jgi:2'-5' RNA ligase
VIWCGLGGELAKLQSLQEQVEAACVEAGFAPEERAFQPHLTLGRVRGKTNLQALCDYIRIGSALENAFVVDGFHLYQSILRPEGALYRVLEAIAIRSA